MRLEFNKKKAAATPEAVEREEKEVRLALEQDEWLQRALLSEDHEQGETKLIGREVRRVTAPAPKAKPSARQTATRTRSCSPLIFSEVLPQPLDTRLPPASTTVTARLGAAGVPMYPFTAAYTSAQSRAARAAPAPGPPSYAAAHGSAQPAPAPARSPKKLLPLGFGGAAHRSFTVTSPTTTAGLPLGFAPPPAAAAARAGPGGFASTTSGTRASFAFKVPANTAAQIRSLTRTRTPQALPPRSFAAAPKQA
ncbi:hypothetical protein DIPPA_08003 [Diplonema papillatum]|nr:hypothetical protein DIPPA_08003 [Diplonema papillatum]